MMDIKPQIHAFSGISYRKCIEMNIIKNGHTTSSDIKVGNILDQCGGLMHQHDLKHIHALLMRLKTIVFRQVGLC